MVISAFLNPLFKQVAQLRHVGGGKSVAADKRRGKSFDRAVIKPAYKTFRLRVYILRLADKRRVIEGLADPFRLNRAFFLHATEQSRRCTVIARTAA